MLPSLRTAKEWPGPLVPEAWEPKSKPEGASVTAGATFAAQRHHRAAFAFAEEGQAGGLGAGPLRREAHVRGAAAGRHQRDVGAVLVEQLEAAGVAAGDDADEEAGGTLPLLWTTMVRVAPVEPTVAAPKSAGFGVGFDDRPAAFAAELGGEASPLALA